MGRRRKARNRTRVFVVQDKSGSMHSRQAETISGFNEYVDELADKAEGTVTLSLIQFDTRVDTIYTDKPVDEVPDLDHSTFVPGGMTALRDAVGRAIRDAENVVGDNDKVLVVIMTDGGENSSREYTHEAVLRQIESKRKDGWEFVFLGAGEEAWNAGAMLGIDATHTINYSSFDAHDHKSSYDALAASTVNLTRGASAAFNAEVKSKLEEKAKKEVRSR